LDGKEQGRISEHSGREDDEEQRRRDTAAQA
jgi:hypothetical protein